MTASEIRQEARKSLTGKWGKAALATLVFFVIDYVISFVLNLVPAIGAIASTIISVPLSFGFIVVVMAKLKRGEEISYIEFFKNGFDKFAKVWHCRPERPENSSHRCRCLLRWRLRSAALPQGCPAALRDSSACTPRARAHWQGRRWRGCIWPWRPACNQAS